MPKALHRHPSKRRRTAREKKRPWTTEPQPTASRKHKYPGAHVERRGRMRTTQAPGDRTHLGLFCFTLDLERDIQRTALQDATLIPGLNRRLLSDTNQSRDQNSQITEIWEDASRGEQAQAP